MQACDLCGGSGRDVAAPDRLKCFKCGGVGSIPDTMAYDYVPGRSSSTGQSAAPALAVVVLGFFGILLALNVLGGYVLAAEMVWNYWAGGKFWEHNWTRLIVFTGASLGAVVVTARLIGVGPGAVVGMLPALPLYRGTEGGVGFWFIVFHTEDKPINNVTASWIALAGMVLAHCVVAWAARRRDEGLLQSFVRWQWIRTPRGLLATGILATAALVAFAVVKEAADAF